MTRRAARMLSALEAGCETRSQIFDHQGGFSMLNNAAAELRAAGIEVSCEVDGGEYHYRLSDGVLSEREHTAEPASSPVAPSSRSLSAQLAPLIPEDCAVPSPGEGLHVAAGGLSEARVAPTPPVESCATANTGLAEPTGGQLALEVAA